MSRCRAVVEFLGFEAPRQGELQKSGPFVHPAWQPLALSIRQSHVRRHVGVAVAQWWHGHWSYMHKRLSEIILLLHLSSNHMSPSRESPPISPSNQLQECKNEKPRIVKALSSGYRADERPPTYAKGDSKCIYSRTFQALDKTCPMQTKRLAERVLRTHRVVVLLAPLVAVCTDD